jgi:hypothetical protein
MMAAGFFGGFFVRWMDAIRDREMGPSYFWLVTLVAIGWSCWYWSRSEGV